MLSRNTKFGLICSTPEKDYQRVVKMFEEKKKNNNNKKKTDFLVSHQPAVHLDNCRNCWRSINDKN